MYSKKDHVEEVFPILDWTTEDVLEFILDRDITLAPHYYDADGTLHIERRLGCVGCPMANMQKRLQELKEHPLMVKAFVKHFQVFIDTHPNNKRLARNAYEGVLFNLFCETKEQMVSVQNGGVLGSAGVVDSKVFLEDYFGIEL